MLVLMLNFTVVSVFNTASASPQIADNFQPEIIEEAIEGYYTYEVLLEPPVIRFIPVEPVIIENNEPEYIPYIQYIPEGPDRTQRIYDVYKRGWPVYVSAEWQWMIRDYAEAHGFCERWIFGLILVESTFNPYQVSPSGVHLGWGQIDPFWLRFSLDVDRLTDNYLSRNLFDPYDNLLTMIEIWQHAVDRYNLDISTPEGLHQLAFWHNTGQDPRWISNFPYSHQIVRYANELVDIIY